MVNKNLIVCASLILFSLSAKSQVQNLIPNHSVSPWYQELSFFQTERNYVPYTFVRADQVKGKATVTDDWAKGTITMKNEDVVYAEVDLSYNQVEDQLYVKTNKGVVVLNNPIKEFTIADGADVNYFRSGFPSINTNDDGTIYEVLKDGKYKLLKREEKNVFVTAGYNMVIDKRYNSSVKYYVNEGDKIYEIKISGKSIQEAVDKHGLPVGSLFDNGSLLKNENQLVALINKLP